MSDAFDPYYTWLAIPPGEQPPNHYRLLGVLAFEDNIEVITNAGDRQMTHLRQASSGKRGELAERLLTEVAGAIVCLANPAKKRAYDKQLRDHLNVAEVVMLQAEWQVDDDIAALMGNGKSFATPAAGAVPPRRASAPSASAERVEPRRVETPAVFDVTARPASAAGAGSPAAPRAVKRGPAAKSHQHQLIWMGATGVALVFVGIMAYLALGGSSTTEAVADAGSPVAASPTAKAPPESPDKKPNTPAKPTTATKAPVKPPVAPPTPPMPVPPKPAPPKPSPPPAAPPAAPTATPANMEATAKKLMPSIACVRYFADLTDVEPTMLGMGIVVDRTGMVAASLAAARNSARIEVIFGNDYQHRYVVTGYRATSADIDLAVLQVAGKFPQLTAINIDYNASPAVGEKVWAVGIDSQGGYIFDASLVTGVQKTVELTAAAQQYLKQAGTARDDTTWIGRRSTSQAPATGPLIIDSQGRALAFNGWTNSAMVSIYHCHIRHLRELIKAGYNRAADPLNQQAGSVANASYNAAMPTQFDVAAMVARIDHLDSECDAWAWEARSDAHYAKFREMGALLTALKNQEAKLRPGDPLAKTYAPIFAVAERTIAKLDRVDWAKVSSGQVLTKMADRYWKVSEGTYFFGHVRALENDEVDGENRTCALTQMDGGTRWVAVLLPRGVTVEVGSRIAVVGAVAPYLTTFESTKPQQHPCVWSAKVYVASPPAALGK